MHLPPSIIAESVRELPIVHPSGMKRRHPDGTHTSSVLTVDLTDGTCVLTWPDLNALSLFHNPRVSVTQIKHCIFLIFYLDMQFWGRLICNSRVMKCSLVTQAHNLILNISTDNFNPSYGDVVTPCSSVGIAQAMTMHLSWLSGILNFELPFRRPLCSSVHFPYSVSSSWDSDTSWP